MVDHRTERGNRAYQQIAENLTSGYALSRKDIGEIYASLGYNPSSATLFTNRLDRFRERTSISVRVDKIAPGPKRGVSKLYTDASLPLEDTDFEQAKLRIIRQEYSHDNPNTQPSLTAQAPEASSPSTAPQKTSEFLSQEQIEEMCRMHDFNFANGLNGVMVATPGRMLFAELYQTERPKKKDKKAKS